MDGLGVAVLGLGSVLGITLQAGFVIVVRKSMSFGTIMEGSLICKDGCGFQVQNLKPVGKCLKAVESY